MRVKVWDENCQLICVLKIETEDIEETVARCGWTCLNDASDLTEDDKTEISRIDRQGFAAMITQNSVDALKWWNERKIKEV